MCEKLLRLRDVEERVGFKKSEIYERIKDGTFPAQKKLGKKLSVWTESSIETWIQNTLVAS